MHWRVLVLLIVSATIAGCGAEEGPPPRAESLSSPAEEGSGQPRLYTDTEGRLWLSWVAAVGDDRHALRFAIREHASWSEPVTVTTGANWFVNWADLPGVRPLPNGGLAAHYLESTGPNALAYGVRISQRTTDGSWHEAVTPHRDETPTEHGFVSLLPWQNDRLLAVWLDGRQMSGNGHGQGNMTLRSATMASTGEVTERHLLDERTCECCATSAVRIGDEALVAYRDRSADEVRDISLVRFNGETWSSPTRLHDDGWQIEGCPVNGPALAADGERVVAAWFTAAGGVPRVKAALSNDGGHTFTDPVVLAEGRTKGRVDAVILDDGAAISWLAERQEGGIIRVRGIRQDRSLAAPATVASLSSAGRDVGFPKLTQDGDTLYAAWVGTNQGPGERGVKMARLPMTQIW